MTELGGAFVPFRFDVHAMIYSEDAPALENHLHGLLEKRSVNRINSRKEFFNVSLASLLMSPSKDMSWCSAALYRVAVGRSGRITPSWDPDLPRCTVY